MNFLPNEEAPKSTPMEASILNSTLSWIFGKRMAEARSKLLLGTKLISNCEKICKGN